MSAQQIGQSLLVFLASLAAILPSAALPLLGTLLDSKRDGAGEWALRGGQAAGLVACGLSLLVPLSFKLIPVFSGLNALAMVICAVAIFITDPILSAALFICSIYIACFCGMGLLCSVFHFLTKVPPEATHFLVFGINGANLFACVMFEICGPVAFFSICAAIFACTIANYFASAACQVFPKQRVATQPVATQSCVLTLVFFNFASTFLVFPVFLLNLRIDQIFAIYLLFSIFTLLGNLFAKLTPPCQQILLATILCLKAVFFCVYFSLFLVIEGTAIVLCFRIGVCLFAFLFGYITSASFLILRKTSTLKQCFVANFLVSLGIVVGLALGPIFEKSLNKFILN